MKKWILFSSIFIVLIFLLSGIVSAQSGFYGDLSSEMQKASTKLIDITQNLFTPFFSALFGPTDLLFEKVLFFILILAVVYAALSRVPVLSEKAAVLWIITLVVAIIATRYLTEVQLINTIILPYSVLGVALTAIIPFIIFFFFIEGFDNTFIRKLGWILFTIIFLGLWFSRYSQLGRISHIYLFAAIATILFLFADGTIRRVYINMQINQLGAGNRQQFETDIIRQINQARADYASNVITKEQADYTIRHLQRKLKALRKL